MSSPEVLKEIPLFAGLSREQLSAIAERGFQRSVAEDDLVFEQGAASDELFVLLDGRVQITIEMSRATEQAPVHTVVPGKVFGEFALLAGLERSATARAVKDANFFVLPRHAFEELAETDPELGYKVLRELTQVLVGRVIKTTKELRSSLMF